MNIVCIVNHINNVDSFLILNDAMEIVEISKSELLNLGYSGKIEGFGIVKEEMVGVNGFELSKVPVYSEGKLKSTDLEEYKNFMAKERLLGKQLFKVNIFDCNNIHLVECCDKEDTGTLVIPSFISRINAEALSGCEYT